MTIYTSPEHFIAKRPDTGGEMGKAFGGGIGDVLKLLAKKRIESHFNKQKAEGFASRFRDVRSRDEEVRRQEAERLRREYEQNFGPEGPSRGSDNLIAGSDSGTIGALLDNLKERRETDDAGGRVQQTAPPQREMPQQTRPRLAYGEKDVYGNRTFEKRGFKNLPLGADISDEMLSQLPDDDYKRARQMRNDFLEEKLATSKRNAPYRKEISEGLKSAQESNIRLGRMESLIDSGQLNPAAYVAALDFFGLGNVSALKSPASQEFEKISTDFLKDVKSIFGARITEYEVKSFLKTIPTLLQTDEGKRRVIQNLKLMNDTRILRSQVERRITNENRGVEPLDLQEQVDERMQAPLDKMSEEFKEGLTPFSFGNPKEMKRGVYRDENTGIMYRNDGKGFQKIAQSDFEKGQREYEDISEIDPAQYKNQIITDNETGIKYFSDGKRFVEASPEEEWNPYTRGIPAMQQAKKFSKKAEDVAAYKRAMANRRRAG